MSTSLFLVLVLVAAFAEANRSLERIQQPMRGVNVKALNGPWFCTFRKPPCSFQGSKEFANIQQRYSLRKNAITSQLTWGTKYCNNVYAEMVLTKIPGVFLFKDTYGNSLSSKMVVIGTDYKTFLCTWGCTKFTVFGDRCEDPYIFVNTRMPQPNKKIISRVNAILMKRFGITINYLDRVMQNGACSSGGGPGGIGGHGGHGQKKLH